MTDTQNNICPSCEQPIKANTKFCIYCGEKLPHTPSEAETLLASISDTWDPIFELEYLFKEIDEGSQEKFKELSNALTASHAYVFKVAEGNNIISTAQAKISSQTLQNAASNIVLYAYYSGLESAHYQSQNQPELAEKTDINQNQALFDYVLNPLIAPIRNLITAIDQNPKAHKTLKRVHPDFLSFASKGLGNTVKLSFEYGATTYQRSEEIQEYRILLTDVNV